MSSSKSYTQLYSLKGKKRKAQLLSKSYLIFWSGLKELTYSPHFSLSLLWQVPDKSSFQWNGFPSRLAGSQFSVGVSFCCFSLAPQETLVVAGEEFIWLSSGEDTTGIQWVEVWMLLYIWQCCDLDQHVSWDEDEMPNNLWETKTYQDKRQVKQHTHTKKTWCVNNSLENWDIITVSSQQLEIQMWLNICQNRGFWVQGGCIQNPRKEIDLCVCGHMKFKFMVRENGNFFQGNALAKYRKNKTKEIYRN